MAGNLFADAGLVARGFNDAGQDNAKLAEMERSNAFNTAIDPIKIKTAQYGLEDTERQRANAAAMRSAVSGADPAGGRLGVTEAAANAARGAGDFEAYSKLTGQIPTLQREGWGELVRGALTGLPPEQAVANFNRMGAGRIAAAEWGRDPKTGDVLMNLTDANTGEKQVMNATKLFNVLNPQKSEVHPIGERGSIVTTPGRPNEIISPSTPDKFDLKDGILFNVNKGTWMQLDNKGDWHLGTITNGSTEVPVRINRRSGDVEQLGPGGQRSGMAAHVTFSPTGGDPFITTSDGKVFQFKSATEAKPAEGGFLGFGGSSGAPGQPARMEPVATPQQPPVPGARQGKYPDGRDGWFAPDPKSPSGWSAVNAASPSTAPATTTQVKYSDNVPPEDRAAVEAVATKAVPSASGRSTYTEEDWGKSNRKVQPAPKPGGAQKVSIAGREYDLGLEGKDSELRRLGTLSRLKGQDPNLDTKTWIDYASRLRALKKQGFAKGGMVTKKQRYGLG